MAELKDTAISGNLSVTGAANINNGAQISGGDVTFLNTGTGDSPALIFQRGTLSDNYNDWKIVDTGGNLKFQQRGNGSTSWTNEVDFSTAGQVTATGFTGDGTNLTNVLHSVVAGTGLTGGTVSDGGTIALDTTRALTTADITTGTDTTNKLVSAKTLADALGGLGGGTVTSVGLSNASGESDFTISGSPVTTAGTITIEHANSTTAKSTQAVYPITFDKHGHITGSGSAVTVPTASDTYSSTSSDVMTGKGVNAALQTLDSSISATTGQAISAITITDGKISASSKIAVGDANQNAFSNVKVGTTTIAADTTTDTLELVAGTDITLTPDSTNDKVTIAFSNASGYTTNTGTVTSVGISNAANGGLSVSGSPVTGSGSITVGHSNVLTNAQTTQAVYPIAIDKNGHISSYGTAITPIADPTTKTSGQYLKYNGTTWVADNVAAGVSDVQINGTSILSSGVANIPYADYQVSPNIGTTRHGLISTGSQRIPGHKSFYSGINTKYCGFLDIADSVVTGNGAYWDASTQHILFQQQYLDVATGTYAFNKEFYSLPAISSTDVGAYTIITTKNVSDITNTAYNASTNKVATMTDINNAMTVVTFTPDGTNRNLMISVQQSSSIQNGNEVSY